MRGLGDFKPYWRRAICTWQTERRNRKMPRTTICACDSYDDAVLVILNWIPWKTVLESYVLAINRVRQIQKMLQSTNREAQ